MSLANALEDQCRSNSRSATSQFQVVGKTTHPKEPDRIQTKELAQIKHASAHS